MKAIIINQFGSEDVLEEQEVDKPEPKEGEVLVKIRAAGINPVDWKIREGKLKDRIPHQFPFIPGWDFAGIIEKQGYSARRFDVGDEVFGYARQPVVQYGTYAEYITLPESYISYKPRNLSFEQAAAIPLASLTAYQSLFCAARLQKNDKILILGASGGVGSFAVQFAYHHGSRIYTVASSKNHEYLQQLGAIKSIDYQKDDFARQIHHYIPGGVDVVFDCVGGGSQTHAANCVKENGQFVSILAYETETEQILKERNANQFYVFVEPNSNQLKAIRKQVEEGKLQTNLSRVYQWQDIKQAHQQISALHTRGKIVLQIPNF